jgi:hypothetical protein
MSFGKRKNFQKVELLEKTYLNIQIMLRIQLIYLLNAARLKNKQ